MNQTSTTTREPQPVEPNSSFFQRHIITPIVDLLRVGCSPRKLAWSLVAGLVIGVNPLLGSTTLLCLAVAAVLRLNLVASQITNHAVYPLQLALFFAFIRIGDLLFHTGSIPLDRHQLFYGVRHHPLETTRILWTWEWHALIVWILASAIAAPILVALITPLLNRVHARLHRNDSTSTAHQAPSES